MVTVLLDPGHGGTDGGAGTAPYLEKTRNLELALKVRDYLLSTFTVNVIMSRTTDKTVSLDARTNLANQQHVDYFLSIHHNSGTPSARGFEDFTYINVNDTSTSDRIRAAIHTEVENRILNKYGLPNRGKKKANFHVLRESTMASTLLEIGFVSNISDQHLIANPAFYNDVAVAISEGVAKGLGLVRKKSTAATPSPTTSPSKTFYRVQVGAYKERTNAVAMQTRLKSAGFPTILSSSNGIHRVQIGAYGNKDNATAMERRLRSAGFPVFVYQV
ncbi:N-acetylmuramoyl-L-alanine amidase [Priestia aryabhattai B8W22]|uniref:N-acetylmuramoyl-L-alanine amidase n=1 Tax=Priestia aryabhattai TaxID=412384 RepID=UPI000884EEE5|nr:N-acetylmuramoyl-L-alanine amidase [Priestia aryabhattai B8W22]